MTEQSVLLAPGESPLSRLFAPRSIAIVGASGNPASMMARPLEYLLARGFGGAIYPVNPRYEAIAGVRAFPSLRAIEADVDLVLIFVPAADVAKVIDECPHVNASVAVVFSSGFAETGAEGAELQRQLANAARRANVRLIGPNCQGFIYTPHNVVATFTQAAADSMPDRGFAFVGQSGALGGYLLGLARESGLGMTSWVSTGNEADCTSTELATALLERDEVKVVALYLESVGDPRELVMLAERSAALSKPVVVLLAGRSASGWRAAVSHTGAMSRPGEALISWARRAGFVFVDDLDQLHDTSLTLLASRRAPGRRVAAVTTSGGAGSLIADHVERVGLTLADVPAPLKAQLSELIPAFGSTENPIDVTAQLFRDGTMTAFLDIVGKLTQEPAFDQVIVVVTTLGGQLGVGFADAIAELRATSAVPVHVCWLAAREFSAAGRAKMRDHGLPVYSSIRDAVDAAATLAASASSELPRWVPKADPRFSDLPELLTESDAGEVLDAAGVPRPRSLLVTTPGEAAAAVRELGGIAVLKVQSLDALHKTEKGLVRLGVREAEASAVAAELLVPEGDGSARVLVQEQLFDGFELLVSVRCEAAGLPPLLTVGAGGVQAEVWKDLASMTLPVDRLDVERLLRTLRCDALLRGYRGDPGYDVGAAVDVILRVAHAAELIGERLLELEINPLIVQRPGGGARAADALVQLTPRNGDMHSKLSAAQQPVIA
jgi:acyl-CoA synthetase (NDP forming)